MTPSILISFLLVLGRIGGFFAFLPLPGGKDAPDSPRIVLSLGFTLALFPQWPSLVGEPKMGWLIAALMSEVALGVTLGLAVACLAEALLMTMQIVGLQAGYGYASTIDPTTQADATVLLVLAQLIGGLLFFAAGLDREMLRAFARSLVTHPAGTFAVKETTAALLVRLTGGIFSSGIRLALPVVALLTLVDLALALAGRLNAQLQLVLLAFPAKMLVTLGLLGALAVLVPRLYGALARQALSAVVHLVGN
jgi:flagellar biosynthetic protein FliR